MARYGTRVHPAHNGKIDFSLRGSIIESPAVDPDGNIFPDMVMVRWDDDVLDIVDVDDLVTVEAWISV